jgi:hypothetical protein
MVWHPIIVALQVPLPVSKEATVGHDEVVTPPTMSWAGACVANNKLATARPSRAARDANRERDFDKCMGILLLQGEG